MSLVTPSRSSHLAAYRAAFAACPLIAILRGLRPDEAVAVGEALVGAGFRLIEVPLNSPEPFESIRRLRAALCSRAVVGAGTVLTVEQVRALAAADGQLMVAPNMDTAVIAAAAAHGLAACPGIATATEAFAALGAGATALKAFPAELIPPAAIKAWLAVLPPGTALLPVGGITPENMGAYRAAGAVGFGIGSAVFKPGMTAQEVASAAARFVAAL
jgi:2-dehydro-3-deoxyphosphogalactonate aldolase